MSILKRYWFLIIIVLLLGYCTNSIVQSTLENSKKERILAESNLQIEKNIMEAIRSNNANYKWMKKFQFSPTSRKMFSSDYEAEWISKGPIFFPGYINNMSNLDAENYQLNFHYLKLHYIVRGTSLNLICKKSIVDLFLLKNPSATSLLDGGVAVIASISSISIDSEGHQIGNGRCIEFLKDVNLGMPYKLIIFD